MSALWPAKVWLVLMALTLASTFVAEASGSAAFVIVAIFVVAIVKAELVLTNYMETPRAGRLWQIMYRSWAAVVTVMLIAGNLVD